MKQIGHEQHGVGGIEHGRTIALQGQELKERVEAHELDAGLAKDFGARHPAKGLLHDGFGVWIAVVPRIAQENTVSPQKPEIHSPGIHPDAGDRPMLRCLAHALQHLPIQTKNIPVKRIERLHRPVGETMEDFKIEALAVEQAQEAAAALGAQIEGEDFFAGSHGFGPTQERNEELAVILVTGQPQFRVVLLRLLVSLHANLGAVHDEVAQFRQRDQFAQALVAKLGILDGEVLQAGHGG